MKKLNISVELEQRDDGWGLILTWAEPGTRYTWDWRRRLWERRPTEADYVAVAGLITEALVEQQMIQGTREVEDAKEQDRLLPEAIIHRPDDDVDAATGQGRY